MERNKISNASEIDLRVGGGSGGGKMNEILR
jgi:hypothetical protein